MRHVAPHRWADAATGKVTIEERARMTAHAASCARCAGERERVMGAREAFADLAKVQAPELRWEQLGARVYWAASQERRARTGERSAVRPRRRWWLAAPALAVVAGAAAGVAWYLDEPEITRSPDGSRSAEATVEVAPAMPDEIIPVEVVELAPRIQPVPMMGLVTLAQGEARLAGASGAGVFAQPVVAGLHLDTGDGRIAVQVDTGTAFAIGPDSRLEIARLDAAAIELHVDGEVSVEVSHRRDGQRFVVVAGDRTVEVRGTAFEVVHEGGRVEVRCRHGLVAVRDSDDAAGAAVEVAAGKRWAADAGEPLTSHVPARLTAEDITGAVSRAPVMLPAWSDAPSLLRTTGPLAIAAPARRTVRIDGVEVGRGDLSVRVMSGRHLVEAERSPGRYAPGQWIATRDDGAPAEVTITTEPAGAGAVKTRRAQLDDRLDRARAASCVRSLAKQGLAEGTYVFLELGVDETGAVSFLNVGSTDLPDSMAGCVRDLVAQTVRFPAGPAATWKHKIAF
jgi:ferric-dicitrate binding protein FerR (iron transport regulator)